MVLKNMKNNEIPRCRDLVELKVCSPNTHETVCERMYDDEITQLQEEEFLYQNTNFKMLQMVKEFFVHSYFLLAKKKTRWSFRTEKFGQMARSKRL